MGAAILLPEGKGSVVVEYVVGRERRRLVRGWRAARVSATLDWCARVEGYVDIGEGVTLRGLAPREYFKAYARKNVEKARANSRVQTSRWRDRVRIEWSQYCAMYAERFPGSEPVGFDRWSRTFRAKWLADAESCMVPNDRTDLAEHGVRSPAS